MSIQFDDPMNEKTVERLKEMFKDNLVAFDERLALVNSSQFRSDEMSELARTAGQPAKLTIHDEGDIKTMSDVTQYKVTPQGWRRYGKDYR